MSIATPQAEKRVLVSNISWSTFEDLARSDRAGARVNQGFLQRQPGIEEVEGWRSYEQWLRRLKP